MLELPLHLQQMEPQELQILVVVVEPDHIHKIVVQMVVQV